MIQLCLATMYPPVKRKVLDMPIYAGRNKSGWNQFVFFPAVPAGSKIIIPTPQLPIDVQSSAGRAEVHLGKSKSVYILRKMIAAIFITFHCFGSEKISDAKQML